MTTSFSTACEFVMTKKQVVPEHSAKLGIENEVLVAMNTDHRGICRFDSSTDPDYVRVANRVKELVGEARTKKKEQPQAGKHQ